MVVVECIVLSMVPFGRRKPLFIYLLLDLTDFIAFVYGFRHLFLCKDSFNKCGE